MPGKYPSSVSLFVWLMKDETCSVHLFRTRNCRPSGKNLFRLFLKKIPSGVFLKIFLRRKISFRASENRRSGRRRWMSLVFTSDGVTLQKAGNFSSASEEQQRARNFEGIRSRFVIPFEIRNKTLCMYVYVVCSRCRKRNSFLQPSFMKHRVMLKFGINCTENGFSIHG